MNSLDYLAQAPRIHQITQINIPEVTCYSSYMDIPVYEIRKPGCGVVLVDLVFHAGRPQEHKKMVAATCAALMREGAGPFSADQISEEIDFLGASLSIRANHDFITIKGVCLRKHISSIFKVIGTILQNPHYDGDELNHFIEKSKERLKIQLAKVDVLSYRKVTEAIYGETHPYGYNSSAEDFAAIVTEDLRRHYADFITAANCKIFLAGDINEGDKRLVETLCKNINTGGQKAGATIFRRHETIPEKIFIDKSSSQTSIRLGRKACTRNHRDFQLLNYTCNILGGYFGSKLVAKIREKEGLTYGIYSMLDTQFYDGDLMISTEVATENSARCLELIYEEMDRMCTDPISDVELERVNNYMMGNYLNLFDGPFNSIRAIKSLALAQIPLDDINTLIKSSLSFDAYQVMDMSRKYFNRNDFWEVIVGSGQ